MFVSDYAKLRLSFNEFHNIEKTDMPEYDEFCLLELKEGGYTAGKWMPDNYKQKGRSVAGKFIRGTADAISSKEVAKWHSLTRYDVTNCLVEEAVNFVNLGPQEEGGHSVVFKDFKSIKDGDLPKKDQYCLLIMTDGLLRAGRWYPYREPGDGCFIYAPALASFGKNKVWAWTPLSPDPFFERTENIEQERLHEEELNRNATADPVKFKYGTDINVYYEKALKKLKKKYPWASVAQMKKVRPWEIVPYHGQYVIAFVSDSFFGTKDVKEWTEGNTADEFIDYLCEYTRETVEKCNPDVKFKYGRDIKVYLEKAYEEVKKDYRWFDMSMTGKYYRYDIQEVEGDPEFVRIYKEDGDVSVCDYYTAESFIDYVAEDYRGDALDANPVVSTYNVPFGCVELHGWYLEKYVFSRLESGDYKVDVQAGDRTTGGGRTFFITPYCFEADTYEEFLDRYLDIVPGARFGMNKEDLLPNKDLKKFLGY